MKTRRILSCAMAVMAFGAVVQTAASAGPAAATGKLAYVAAVPGEKGDIYVAEADGSGAVDITNTPTVDETQPVFSPDGTRLVFRIPGNGLWLINVDGSGLTQLTSGKADQHPDWSPGGTAIVFSRCCDSDQFDSELFIVNADGSNPHRILDNTTVRDDFPSWSPDGQWIVFTADPVGVFLIHPDGTGVRSLMSESNGRIDFDWSPGGQTTVLAEYTTPSRTDADIYGMKAFGTTTTQITSGPDVDRQPAWTPDTTKIAFTRTGTEGMSAIYLMNPNGTGIAPLTSTTDELSESDPTWQRI